MLEPHKNRKIGKQNVKISQNCPKTVQEREKGVILHTVTLRKS